LEQSELTSYEETNWAKLSPLFRKAHNQLRIQRGLSPLPEPKVDLYVPPPPTSAPESKVPPPPTSAPESKVRQSNPRDGEFLASAREFLGPRFILPGAEGFTVNGRPTK
jgi:hypothetical protein